MTGTLCVQKPCDAASPDSGENNFQVPPGYFFPTPKLDEPKLCKRARYSGKMDTASAVIARHVVIAHLRNFVSRLNRLHNAVDELCKLKPDWNGYGSEVPNQTAAKNAKALLGRLLDIGLTPDRIVASAENGVGIYMESGVRYAIVECLNEGQIVAGLSDRQGFIQTWEFASGPDGNSESLQRISGFLDE